VSSLVPTPRIAGRPGRVPPGSTVVASRSLPAAFRPAPGRLSCGRKRQCSVAKPLGCIRHAYSRSGSTLAELACFNNKRNAAW